MNKPKKSSEVSTLVMIESVEDFFTRGKRNAVLLDKKKPVPVRRIISFEDANDLIKFLTQNKLKLVSAIRQHPNSVSGLAKVLKRSRASVDQDIQELESIGLLRSQYVVNPGHGKCKMIMAIDKEPVRLQVQAVI